MGARHNSYRGECGHLVLTQREVEDVEVVGVVTAPVARGDRVRVRVRVRVKVRVRVRVRVRARVRARVRVRVTCCSL